MIQPNYDYRAITKDAAEKRAVEQSFAQSTLWGFTVEAESNNHYLVDATDFLLRDAMQVASRIKSGQQGNYTLDKTRSAIYLPRTKNFPLNTDFETTITFINNDGITGNFVNSVTPSPEAITLRMHHSFVQLPDNDYKPRVFDPRSSYIPVSYYDYSTPVTEPIEKFYIMRHRLKKKDPSAAKSEAVKPIIYYLDNGTPEPIRSALLEGASWWNQAFEAAGYINAFQVKILPEDADPMDIRYNIINWVHRSTRGWSYGASVVDPRTGEIIKGQVTLGSLRVRQDYLIATGLLAPFENGMPDDNKIGEWDKAAISFGYSDFASGINEETALNKILSDAEKKGLQFISDRDARAPGGLHPQAHLWDNGIDAVAELKNVMKIRNKALSDFGEKNIRPGMPMAMLEDVLVPVYFYHRYQVEAATKVVGGMFYNYSLRGDGQIITRSLSREEQLTALNAIIDCIDPKFLRLHDRIAQIIPPLPSGYSFSRELFKKRTGLAFDVLSPAETAADLPLSFLFNSERLNRMVQYETMNKV